MQVFLERNSNYTIVLELTKPFLCGLRATFFSKHNFSKLRAIILTIFPIDVKFYYNLLVYIFL